MNNLKSMLFAFIGMALIAMGCQESSERRLSFESKPEVRADDSIRTSFAIANLAQAPGRQGTDLQLDKAQIVLAKSALEKEFLLRGSIVQQVPVASFSGLQSRVVAFRQRADKVYMLEATQGHTASPSLPQNLVLAEFSVLKEDAQNITFDFNAGMSQLYTASGWYAQEEQGNRYDPGYTFQSSEVKHAYIESAEMTGENELSVRQVAMVQVNSPKPMEGQINIPVEVRYFLSPYRPSANFKPKLSTKNKLQFGFFESLPTMDLDGNTNIFATKHDHSNPIVYAISANTPAEMKDAVKEGILYWNKAFGTEVVKVVDAPSDVVTPDNRFNVIQWINWDQAGMAYADAQMDPRTGEIKNAQVFMTSAFEFIGKVRARRFLQTLKDSRQKLVSHIGLKGLSARSLCDFPVSANLENGLEKLLADNADEAKILSIAQDYVRMVVSHEVGHTMGLRHNFAGSLGASFPLSDKANMIKNFVKDGTLAEGTHSSSSVMEYSEFFDDVFDGQFIKNAKTALPYDEKAIQNLYNGKEFAQKDTPLFCTDGSESKYLDCAVFDSGVSAVEFAPYSMKDISTGLPRKLVETFVQAKAPFRGVEPKSPEYATLPVIKDSIYSSLLLQQYKLAAAMTDKGQILKIHRQYPMVTELNQELVLNDQQVYLKDEIQKLGGFEAAFAGLPVDFVAQSTKEFNRLMESPDYRSGKGLAGQDYAFTDDEVATAEARAAVFFQKYYDAAKKAQTEILAGKSWDDKPEQGKLLLGALADSYAVFLNQKSKDVVLATTGKTQEAQVSVGEKGSKKPVKVQLPEFANSVDSRVMAAGFLNAERSKDVSWGLFERQTLEPQISEYFEKILSVPLSKIEASDADSKAAARWILENQSVLRAVAD